MNDLQTKQAVQLLHTALERKKRMPDETAAFNLLSVLHIERYETQTHSRIILFLLNSNHRQDEQDSFLRLFLKAIKVPQTFLTEQWNVYREKAFDGGNSRIDFVIESRSFCAIIEMKVDAADGNCQLARYASFGRKKKKQYCIYYLTLDGREPEEQSVRGVDEEKLKCISFKREIVSWLQDCMKTVKKDGYKYSFLKQYLGAVKHITGIYNEEVNVKDLIDSSEMARAAQIVMRSFYGKMDDVTTEFFQKLSSLLKRKTKLEVISYPRTTDIFLDSSSYNNQTYSFTIGIGFDPYLYACFEFTTQTENNDYLYLRLDEAEASCPAFYKKWMKRIDKLDCLPKLRQSKWSRWFYMEDSRGAQMNFQDNSAQIELIDEMDLQCKFISDNIVNLIIRPLLP